MSEMSQNAQPLIDKICDFVENTVLSEAWLESEEDVKTLLKERNAKHLQIAFRGAVVQSFSEALNELFIEKKIDEKLEKLKTLDKTGGTGTFLDLESIDNINSYVETQVPPNTEEIQSMIDSEIRLTQEIKQRLQFHMSQISEKTELLASLIDKKEEIVGLVNNLNID